MATYKVVDADQLDADMTIVADSIRTKGGTSDALSFPTGFADAIAAIQTGGGSEEEWIGDGNTHIWISLAEGRTSPILGCCPKGTVTVDWGDGTTPDTLTGTSTSTVKWTPTHHYAASGDYVITLTVGGTMGFYGRSSSNEYSGLLRYSSSGNARNHAYRHAVKKIEVGGGVTTIGSYAFYQCYGLASIKIPDGVTRIDSNAFYSCYGLASIKIPDGVTIIGSNAFNSCYNLASIKIPDGVTSIDSSTFSTCVSLASIKIPDGVTKIYSSAFTYCYSLGKIRFESATPPTVESSNVFNQVPTDCVISVPVGSLAAYTSATNYPSSSTYTYIEED